MLHLITLIRFWAFTTFWRSKRGQCGGVSKEWVHFNLKIASKQALYLLDNPLPRQTGKKGGNSTCLSNRLQLNISLAQGAIVLTEKKIVFSIYRLWMQEGKEAEAAQSFVSIFELAIRHSASDWKILIITSMNCMFWKSKKCIARRKAIVHRPRHRWKPRACTPVDSIDSYLQLSFGFQNKKTNLTKTVWISEKLLLGPPLPLSLWKGVAQAPWMRSLL